MSFWEHWQNIGRTAEKKIWATQNVKEAIPEVIKLFFMLNSAEHEIFSANTYENANNSWYFIIY